MRFWGVHGVYQCSVQLPSQTGIVTETVLWLLDCSSGCLSGIYWVTVGVVPEALGCCWSCDCSLLGKVVWMIQWSWTVLDLFLSMATVNRVVTVVSDFTKAVTEMT